MNKTLQQLDMIDVFNAYVSRVSNENPLEYFDRVYSSVHPGAIREAVKSAKSVLVNEKTKKKDTEEANVFLTLGGENLTQNFYTGIVSTLLWLPKYIRECSSKFNINQHDIDTCIEVLNKCQLPQVHDVKEELINNTKVKVEPSGIRYYSAFIASILAWCNSGVTDFSIKGSMKTNMELSRYLSRCALASYPSVPFASYYIGSTMTDDIFKLSEKIGKSFDFTKFMTPEMYSINEPKFVVTTPNAPIVSVVGHPLCDTFIAEMQDGNPKWLGLFIETEEFSRLCTQHGLTTDQLKKYIIGHTPNQHTIELSKHNPIAEFIEKNKITKECFNLRHKFSSSKYEDDEDCYDV